MTEVAQQYRLDLGVLYEFVEATIIDGQDGSGHHGRDHRRVCSSIDQRQLTEIVTRIMESDDHFLAAGKDLGYFHAPRLDDVHVACRCPLRRTGWRCACSASPQRGFLSVAAHPKIAPRKAGSRPETEALYPSLCPSSETEHGFQATPFALLPSVTIPKHLALNL